MAHAEDARAADALPEEEDEGRRRLEERAALLRGVDAREAGAGGEEEEELPDPLPRRAAPDGRAEREDHGRPLAGLHLLDARAGEWTGELAHQGLDLLCAQGHAGDPPARGRAGPAAPTRP